MCAGRGRPLAARPIGGAPPQDNEEIDPWAKGRSSPSCSSSLGFRAERSRGQGQPPGQLTIAFDASIAPTFLDPAETPGIGTPFVFLYAMHDALIKPLPGNDMAPCLAESWKESPDGLTYEFKLRRASSSTTAIRSRRRT